MNKKIIKTVGAIALAVMFLTAAGSAVAGCQGGVCATLVSAGGNGQQASATVTNNSGSSAQVAFYTDKVFVRPYQEGWLSTQVQYASKVITLAAGATQTVSIDTPDCMAQFDVHVGYPAQTEQTILLGVFSNNTNLCVKTPVCTAKTCSDYGYQCGSWSDGCSNTINCGSCSGNSVCSAGRCVSTCQPQTCLQMNYQCGSYSDGCGNTINCGSCSGNSVCTAGRCVSNCQPKTCSQLGMQCGSVYDGCNGNINCGNCSGNQTCQNGHCVTSCQAKTCSQLNIECGSVYDGCNGNINCGSCSGNQACQNGHCVTNCQNQCQSGDRRCSGNGYQVCGNYDGNGCFVWGQVISCGNQYCQNGNCNQPVQNLNVNLSANSGCAPLNNVALHATVSGNYGSNSNYGQNQLIYQFDCGNGGSKTVTTTDSDVIVKDLCNYQNPGNYTAHVRVQGNGVSAQDSTTIEARNCQNYQPVIVPIAPISETLQIQKTVADLSNGTNYQPAVTANPGDYVSFRIAVSANTDCQDVIVNDIIPAGIENIRDLRLDGQPINGDIASGIAIGNLRGQRVITFTATVDGVGYFPFGQTTMVNTATARNSHLSNSSTASIYVWRQAVLGATKVSTGITDSPWFEYLIAGAAVLILIAAIFRKEVLAAIGFFARDAKRNRLEKSAAELKRTIIKVR